MSSSTKPNTIPQLNSVQFTNKSLPLVQRVRSLLLLELLFSFPLLLVFVILGALADHEIIIRFLILSAHLFAPMAALDMIRYVYTDAQENKLEPQEEDAWQHGVVRPVSLLWVIGPILALFFDLGSALDFSLYTNHELENDPHHSCHFACNVTLAGTIYCLWLAFLDAAYMYYMVKIYRKSKVIIEKEVK